MVIGQSFIRAQFKVIKLHHGSSSQNLYINSNGYYYSICVYGFKRIFVFDLVAIKFQSTENDQRKSQWTRPYDA